MSNRTPPKRHPSTTIPDEVQREISYRVYLRRLTPAMEPAEAATYRSVNNKTNVVTDATALQRNSKCMESLTATYLRVLVDMGLVDVKVQP